MVVQISGGAGTAKKPAATAKPAVNAKFATNFGGTTPQTASVPGTGTVLSTPATRAAQQNSGYQAPVGGGGGGGGGGGMSYDLGGGGSAPAPVVAPPSEEDYLAGDSGFQAQSSALQSALQRYLADSDYQKTSYDKDYGKSLTDLGYDEGTKQWNWNDNLTAAGRGYNNQLNDFGSRGMLQSSGYGDAFSELQRLLGQQYTGLADAKTGFMTDMQNQLANYQGENTANQQSARAEALQRRAAQYSL